MIRNVYFLFKDKEENIFLAKFKLTCCFILKYC